MLGDIWNPVLPVIAREISFTQGAFSENTKKKKEENLEPTIEKQSQTSSPLLHVA
jgi:hypothetical protein